MEKKYLTFTFVDEGQKSATLRITDPKDGLEAADAKAAAQTIVDSGAFRAKGKFTAVKQGELTTVTTNTIFQA